MRVILNKFNDGAFFRRFFSIFLYILGVAWAIGGLIFAIYIADGALRNAVGGFVAYIVFLPILLIGLYMTVHAILLRARAIAGLPEAAYTVVPIFSVLLKLAGELGAICILIAGIISGLTAWFGSGISGEGDYLPQSFRWLLGGRGFGAGLGGMAGGCILATAWLTISYFLSEQIVALVDVAVSVKTR